MDTAGSSSGHQFQLLSTPITAGTSIERTKTVSTTTETARTKDHWFMPGSDEKMRAAA